MKVIPMNDTITVEKDAATSTDDAATDFNERVPQWVIHCKRSCNIETQGGREFYRASQLQADMSHLVRLHYDMLTKDITPAMRVKFGTRTLGIISAINENNDNRYIVMNCAELVTV